MRLLTTHAASTPDATSFGKALTRFLTNACWLALGVVVAGAWATFMLSGVWPGGVPGAP